MANIGDTVRFLNDVGGGVITRIEGRIAYVTDSDGFETPARLSDCVVVPSAKEPAAPITPKPASATAARTAQAPAPAIIPSTPLKNNVVLLFEPHDLRRLSQTAFDLYLVNDTPMQLHYMVAARDRLDTRWSVVGHGLCEAGVQEFLGEVFHTELNRFENIAVQLIAFNPDKAFELQAPVALEMRFDVTRLAKLHCFTATDYSSVPVLSLTLVAGGKACHPTRLEALIDNAPVPADNNPRPRKQTPPRKNDGPEVVDLHIDSLLDSTAGLEPAEMLAYQLDVFDQKMTEAAKKPGSSIIFIHGKGEGVLRKAILDRLRRKWPKSEAQDASFREYGFGATRITVRK